MMHLCCVLNFYMNAEFIIFFGRRVYNRSLRPRHVIQNDQHNVAKQMARRENYKHAK